MRNVSSKLVIILSFILIAAVSVSYWQMAVAGTNNQAVDSGLNYLHGQQETSGKIAGFSGSTDWATMAFAANGVDPASVTNSGNSLVDFLGNNPPGSDAAVTDWERAVLAIVAAGADPTNFGGVNYVQKVEAFHSGGQLGNPNQLNDDIFGSLSLVAAGPSSSSNIKNDALKFIISNQNSDGGFSWSATGSSDLDDTGAAIQALKAAEQNGLSVSGLSNAIEKAKTFVLSNQNSDGGFPHLLPGDSNTSSTAWVVMGLNSLGLGSSSQALQAIDYIKNNQKSDGSFAWQPTVSGDTLTTSYALMALSGKFWPIKPVSTDFPEEPEETPKQEIPEQSDEEQQSSSSESETTLDGITVHVKVTGSSGTVFDDQVNVTVCSIEDKEGKTHTFSQPFAICALDAAAKKGDFDYVTKDFGGNLGLFIESIGSDTTTEDFSSFWTYNVNGKQAELGVSNLVVKDGDSLGFIYEQGEADQVDEQSSQETNVIPGEEQDSGPEHTTIINQTTSAQSPDDKNDNGQVLSTADTPTTVGKTAGELSQLPDTGPGLLALLALLSALFGIVLRKVEKFIKLNKIPQMKKLNFLKLETTSGKNHLFLAVVMVIGAVLLRLVPHMPNFAPITATALFGGAYLPKRLALVVPFVAMATSDYLLLYVNPFGGQMFDFSQLHPVTSMFHSTTIFVYGSFFVSLLLGMWLKSHKRVDNVIWITLLASVQFFLITNLGVWAGGMYSRSIDGLFQSYLMGLPFFRWTLLGDLFYTATFFAAFEYSLKLAKNPKLLLAKQYS